MILEYQNQGLFDNYPFLAESADIALIASKWFTDINLVIRPGFKWSYSDQAKLTSLVGNGTVLVATITLTNSDSETLLFTFNFISTDANFTTDWSNSAAGSGSGFGFLTSGDLTEAYSTNLPILDIDIQKSLIQNNSELGINTVNIANKYGQAYSDPECNIDPVDLGDGYKIAASGLTGDIVLRAGRFIAISSNPLSSEFIIGPTTTRFGGGDKSCTPIRVLPDDYDIGIEPSCADLVYSINGAMANNLTNSFLVLGSRGVGVEKVDDNTIGITISPLVLFNTVPDPVDCSS